MREVDAATFDHFIYNYDGELKQDHIDDINRHEVAYIDESLEIPDQLKAVVCYFDTKNLYYIND